MNDVGIGATIARERRAEGVTQAQLAERLGVTKAAVSKWELGQSLPDVALLPRIAAYFGISLDDLFAFRPQLAEDEVRDVYLELCRLFAEDADAAYARMDELVRDYASCWNLLMQMASLYSQRSLVEPERAEELLDRTCSLAERVEANADDVELVRSARVVRALVISQRGGMDEAIALLEGVKPARPLGIEGMLAGLHSMRGEREACLKLCQEMLFWGEMNVMQSIGMQLALYTEDPAHLAALLRAAEGVMEGFDVEEVNPMEAATFCGSAATACLRAGDEEGALSYLERFVGLLKRFDLDGLLFPRRSALFDLVPELAETDVEREQATADTLFGGLDMRGQCKLAVTGDAAWERVADDPRFRPLLDRLASA